MSKLFATMSQIDISKMTERKNGFTYLSWAHAYRLLRQHCPEAEIVKSVFAMPDGRRLPYMVDEQGYAYVQVTVIIEDYTCVEVMPVLNHANRPVQNPDSFAVNASLQRCMAKAISMATGLGIHLYAGEDMPQQKSGLSIEAPLAPQTVKKLDTSTLVSLDAQLENCADLQALKELYNSRLDWTKEQTGLFSARKKELI
jgi:hypothetical protein